MIGNACCRAAAAAARRLGGLASPESGLLLSPASGSVTGCAAAAAVARFFSSSSSSSSSSDMDYSGGGTGAHRGNHPLYELGKIKKTARGEIDITESEPGTGDLPHPTGRMPGSVEAEFRVEEEQEPASSSPDGSSSVLPDFYVGEAPPGERRPGTPGSGDATPLSDPGLKTGRAPGADPHSGTNAQGSYGGQSADYYHGMIPVVTNPMTGMASGTVLDTSEQTRKAVGPVVIRGPGADAVGVNTRPNVGIPGADVSA
ncbi:hypothetical protein HYH02_004082 [Chlamydomonas schloesseri]|uniref:Uncharacterized protein n=1 Tax=Chlamydomonas schloesseri TaxID=2026947 RepID=A0A835WP75_9CHLO|nr:hypothetical protein HYH02_004082 [Chlamydomonas schloesseri]|eukprot:KAG2451484.1 hypothetical protein HYH02_004082 [Chlamydomonas schloesseri]